MSDRDSDFPPVNKRVKLNHIQCESSAKLAEMPFAAQSNQSSISQISRLATVELQLIMQCCDVKSLLALARCSKFTLACADSQFAFKYSNELNVTSHEPNLAQKLSSPLLRHCPISLALEDSVVPSRNLYGEPVTGAEMLLLLSIPQLRTLNAPIRDILWDQRTQLLESLHHLTEISSFIRQQRKTRLRKFRWC